MISICIVVIAFLLWNIKGGLSNFTASTTIDYQSQLPCFSIGNNKFHSISNAQDAVASNEAADVNMDTELVSVLNLRTFQLLAIVIYL